MLRQNRITEVEINGKTKLVMDLCDKDDILPIHLADGEKKSGILYRNGNAEPWNYESFGSQGTRRGFVFDKIDIHPISSLFTTHRKHALDIVENIARVLETCDEDFLDLETGLFPLRRLFIVGEKDVLILPPDMASILSVFMDEESRSNDVSVMYKAKTEKGYTLILEMAELLYYAATGFLPFADDDVRRNRYRYYPLEDALSTYGEKLDEKTAGFINVVLNAKTTQMRDIMGNLSAGKALRWFIENVEELDWNLDDRESLEDSEKVTSSLEYLGWKEKTARVAKKVNFWIRKGSIITISTIAGLVAVTAITSWLLNFFKPPITRDMNQEEIVEFVYECQNTQNSNDISSACKGTKLPQEGEVMNLFVSSKMREAYEAMNPVVRADEWVENGMGPIFEAQMVYGTYDHEIERIDDDSLVVHFKHVSPSTYDMGGEPVIADDDINAYAFIYDIDQTFDFEWNKRGWWNIVDSEYTDVVFDECRLVEQVPRHSGAAPQNPATPPPKMY